jgi:hypothetical protein
MKLVLSHLRFGLTGHIALKHASAAVSEVFLNKQIPCSSPQAHGLGKTSMKRGAGSRFHQSSSDYRLKGTSIFALLPWMCTIEIK